MFSPVASECHLDNFEAYFWDCSGWEDSFWKIIGIVHSISNEELSQGPLPLELIFLRSSEATSPDGFTLFVADDLQTSHILQIYLSLHSSSS